MDRTERRLVAWWAALAGVTLVSWETGGVGGARVVTTLVVLLLAFAKVLVVMLQFMDARSAPWPLKAVLTGYVVIVGSAIAVFWLAG